MRRTEQWMRIRIEKARRRKIRDLEKKRLKRMKRDEELRIYKPRPRPRVVQNTSIPARQRSSPNRKVVRRIHPKVSLAPPTPKEKKWIIEDGKVPLLTQV